MDRVEEAAVSEPIESFHPVKRQTLGEQVAETLRNLISTDRLKPGDRILETELAAKLNVSRGPVRDAFKQLFVEGLLTTSEKGGAYVAEPSANETRALIGLRYRMEEYAIELALGHITPEDIGQLRNITAEMCQARVEDDVVRIQELDILYHRTLWSLAGSKRLTELLALVVSPMLLNKLWQNWQGDVVAAHEEMLYAIAAGDLDAVRRCTARHTIISLNGIQGPEADSTPRDYARTVRLK